MMQKFPKYFYFLHLLPSIVLACTSIELNKEHLNKRLIGYTVLNLTDTGLATCARRCMGVTQCRSYNHKIASKVCELNALASDNVEPDELVAHRGWVFGDVSTWPKAISGECEDKVCGWSQECVPAIPEAVCVDLKGCGEPPAVPYATIKAGGTLMDTRRTYTCAEGYTIQDSTSRSFDAVCSGSWLNIKECRETMCSTQRSVDGFEEGRR